MGNLFPNDPEHPDYVPLPRAKPVQVVIGVLTLTLATEVAAAATEPPQPHAHQEDTVPPPAPVALEFTTSASSMTSNRLTLAEASYWRSIGYEVTPWGVRLL